MSVVDPGMLASEDRPLQLRRRLDLELHKTWYQHEPCWVVKDPVALQYCRLREPEHLVFRLLDGQHSLRDIHARLVAEFPDQLIRMVDVQQLVASLNSQGLLVSGASGQARPLLERAGKIQRQKAVQLLSSALVLRLPGVDPERLLTRLYPWVRWFFTRTCVALCILLGAAAAILLLTNWDEFARRLPDFYSFFGLQNLVAMAGILFVTKTLHELGHGLACRHFGCECHEIGFMFLVMMPVMYCDTSDSWTLKNKWHRMAIGAAGMYVELILAAIATFVWWYTNPGWLHYLSLNIMFLCSVSTIIFNANPLLRYDGYYILSDWLEVPNLSQKSRSALLSKLRVWFLGMDPLPRRQLPERRLTLFAFYSVASVIYRWFVLIVILWFLSELFEPWGLQVVGHFLIALSIIGLVGVPLWKAFRFFSYPGRLRQVNYRRLAVSGSVLAAVLVVVFTLPMDYYVDARLVVRPHDAQKVYVTLPGTLPESMVEPGQTVTSGQVLAVLRNPAEQVRLQELHGEVARLENEIAELQRLSGRTSFASNALVTRQSELRGAQRQLALQQQRIEMLELRADRNGTVIPPPNIEPKKAASSAVQLAVWSGSPLESQNAGAFLNEDTWFCSIADTHSWEAVMLVSQNDVKLLEQGQDARIMLDEYPGQRITVAVTRVSQNRVTSVPRELTPEAGGPISVNPASANQTPLLGYYETTAVISDNTLPLNQGFRGKARIHVGKFTIAWRINRFFRTVFNF
ncbi:MAG: site-2 protease family protein [Pirellulaceae bacterium]